MDKQFEFPERFPEHLREVCEFRVSLDAETDRGCALMVASFLDYKLEQLLIARFVDDPKLVATHMSQSGPLGTFSSRVDAAYLLGLIGENTRRDIHLIRKIRNEFGHSHRMIMFTHDKIQSRCNELCHFHAIESTDDPRKMFVKTSMVLLAIMNSVLHRLVHLPYGKDLYIGEADLVAHQAAIQKVAGTLFDGTPENDDAIMQFLADLLAKKTANNFAG